MKVCGVGQPAKRRRIGRGSAGLLHLAAAGAVAAFASNVAADSYIWTAANNGAWNNGLNWLHFGTTANTFPQARGDVAEFTVNSPPNATASLNQAITIGTLNLDAAASYVVENGAGGSLTFAVPSGTSGININMTAGNAINQTLAADVRLGTNTAGTAFQGLNIRVFNGTFTFGRSGGTIDLGPVGSAATDGGTLTLIGSLTNINSAIVVGTGSGGTVVVASGATASFASTGSTYFGETIIGPDVGNQQALLKLANHGALSPNSLLTLSGPFGSGVLDMAGFNATAGGLRTHTSGVASTTALLTNSGTTAVVLTINSNATTERTFLGLISDGNGTLGLVKTGIPSTLTLTNASSSFTGSIIVRNASTLAVVGTTITNLGQDSAIGRGNVADNAASLVLDNGTLIYDGNPTTGNTFTDRLFTLGSGGGRLIGNNNGTNNFRLTNTGPIAMSGTGNRTLTFGGSQANGLANQFSPQLTDPAGGRLSVTKTGGGKWWINGASNTYSGVTTISTGSIVIPASNLGNYGVAGSFGYGLDGTSGAAIALTSTNNAASLVLAGNNGNAALVLTSATAPSSTNRLFTIAGVAPMLTAANGTNSLFFTNTGAIIFNSFGTNGVNTTLTLNGPSSGANMINNSVAPQLRDPPGGRLSLLKSDGGRWVIGGVGVAPSNTYTGATTIADGSLALRGGVYLRDYGVAGALGPGLDGTAGAAIALTSTNNAASLLLGGGNETGTLHFMVDGPPASTNRLFTLNDAGGGIDASNGTNTITFTNPGVIPVQGVPSTDNLHMMVLTGNGNGQGTSNNTFFPQLTATVNPATALRLAKNGGGTWVLAGASNTYEAGTYVNQGTLKLGVNDAVPLNSTVVLQASTASGSATFDLNGHDQHLSNLIDIRPGTNSGMLSVTNTIDGTAILTLNNVVDIRFGSAGGFIADGSATAKVAIVYIGGPMFTLGGPHANTFSGGLSINKGSVVDTGNTAFGTGLVTVNSPGLANFQASDTIGGLAGNGDVVLTNTAGTTLTVNSSISTTYSGIMSELLGTIGSLTKAGPSALTFTGVNQYTGVTTVAGGTLIIGASGTGKVASDVSVSPGAAVGGSGTIGGTLSVASTAHVAPGNSPGTLTVANAILGNSIVLDYDLDTPNVTAGGGLNDLLKITGSLTLDQNYILNIISGGSPGTYHLMQYGSLIDNSNNFSGWDVTGLNPGDFLFSNNAGLKTIDLTIIVPEPTALGLSIVTGSGLLMRRRRRPG